MNKRQTIINVARKRFARFGLKKTTVEEIAKEAGIGKAGIYELFAGKDQLFESVVQYESELLLKRLRKTVAETSGGPRQKFRALILTKVRHLKNLRNFNGYQVEIFPELKPFIKKQSRQFFYKERKIVEAILTDEQSKGALSIPDTEFVAFAIVMGLKEIETSWVMEHPKVSLETGVDMMLQILFDGIGVR